jgi:serine/alanine adding enzyme
VTTAVLASAPVFAARAGNEIASASQAVAGLAGARLAHAPEWLAVIRGAYGHEPLYLSAEDGRGGRALLPAFVVRRPLGGTVVSSMPFLDGGGPCGSSPEMEDALVARLLEESQRLGAATVEIRCAQRLALAGDPMVHKVNLTLPLPPDAGRLWARLDGSVRNQVRKAEKAGLSVTLGGVEQLDAFYGIFAARMRELGSPVHARGLFTAVFDAFGARARTAIVRQGDRPVGGLVAMAFKDVLTVPWASCASAHRRLCPNMLLYWQTLRAACADGFRTFDFGRSTRDSGTYRFKRQWGAEEEPLYWYSIPTSSAPRRAAARGSATSLFTSSWRRLPLGVTRSLGPCIRKYLTQ